MSGLNGILDLLGNAAKQILPLIVPGSGALIQGAEAISNAFESIKAQNGGQAPADAEAAHDALFARVKAHADSTLNRLENG
jgi:hypothetical protein